MEIDLRKDLGVNLFKQGLEIIEFYYQNACCVKKVHRELLPLYGQFNRATKAAIRAIETKFLIKLTFLDIKPPTRLRRVRTKENIAAVSASALLRKSIARFFHFNRATEVAIRAIVTKFHIKFTLSHHKLKKILQLYWSVLMMTINYRFVNGER